MEICGNNQAIPEGWVVVSQRLDTYGDRCGRSGVRYYILTIEKVPTEKVETEQKRQPATPQKSPQEGGITYPAPPPVGRKTFELRLPTTSPVPAP